MPTLLVIVGPTAVGKTDFAIDVASHYETEIISADSRQIYTELNIGVAKPTSEQLHSVPHHFIGFVPIAEHYSAGKYADQALVKLDELFSRHQLVVCTGGSMMYIDALVNGLDDLPSDTGLKREWTHTYHKEGIEKLQQTLKQLDEAYYREVDLQNPHRLIRAIEVCLLTGSKYSALRSKQKSSRSFGVLKVGLTAQRNHLYKRINQRTEGMMQAGLLAEAESLFAVRHLNALNTVGYKELFAYLEGRCTLSEAVEKIKQHTRNFAKRQLTWWRGQNDIHWMDITNTKPALSFVQSLLLEITNRN